MDEDFDDDDSMTLYSLYTAEVRYNFASEKYATSASSDPEYDQELTFKLKSFFPELAGWESTTLANAWRDYSKDVGLIDEEYVCVRTPDFLGYLFVVQEGWPVNAGEWLMAVSAAIKILWPDVADHP